MCNLQDPPMKAVKEFQQLLDTALEGMARSLSDALATIGAIEKLCLSKVQPDGCMVENTAGVRYETDLTTILRLK